jgi:LDH2 family malate/lactate/ureidoglycolate dehydrogenase
LNGTQSGTTAGPRIPLSDLREFAEEVFRSLGLPRHDAETVAACLLYSEERDHSSHGIIRLPVYGKRVRAGVVEACPAITVSVDAQALAIVDGGNGLGPVVGTYAMDQAISRARVHGVGLVLARNSNHYGASGFYTSRAAAAGCVGFSASNAPSNMAPWGGRERFLGTNPFSIGVPRSGGELNADMASSVVARGNIILAAEKGESIPEGWAIDPEGLPTTNAEAGLKGSVLPFAGPKGAAISLMIDVLCGVLSGASYGGGINTLEDLTTQQNLGHVFLAINVPSCMPADQFDGRVNDLIQQLKAAPRAKGVAEILAPGEPEQQKTATAQSLGVVVPAPVRADLAAFAEAVGARVPEFLRSRGVEERS